MFLDAAKAALLGVVEGLTEFIPVSSTGHLIVTQAALGDRSAVDGVFAVCIQVGSILAVMWVKRAMIMRMIHDFILGGAGRALAIHILIAFFPAVIAGVLFHDFIKGVLFSPFVVGVSLIVGGIIMLAVERRAPPPKTEDVMAFSPLLALKVGLCQLFALIPGVSRSGASIVGAQYLGVSRAAATDFSFYLAIPTLMGAAVYDLYKNRDLVRMDDIGIFLVGGVSAFLCALVVVRTLIGYVQKHGFAPFAYYRIAFGALVLILVFLNIL